MSQEQIDSELKALLKDFGEKISSIRLEVPALDHLAELAGSKGPAAGMPAAPLEPEDETARRIDEMLAAAGILPPPRPADEPETPPAGRFRQEPPTKEMSREEYPPAETGGALPEAARQPSSSRAVPATSPAAGAALVPAFPAPGGPFSEPPPRIACEGRSSPAVPEGIGPPAEAARARRRRLAAWTAGAVLAVIAGAKGVSDWQAHRLKQIHQVFPLPYTNTSALAEKAGFLYTLDPKRGLLFTFGTGDLKVRSVQKFSNPALSGLALGEDSVWSSNAEAGEVYQHYLDPVFSVRNTFSNPESRPTAVHWDGRHLWTSDRRTETISQYSVDAVLTPVRQYTLAGIAPAGIHVSRGLLWIADTLSRKVYRYELGSLLSVRDYFDLGEWLSPNCRVTGFAVGESHLWLITENPAELHRFRLDGLEAAAKALPANGTTPR